MGFQRYNGKEANRNSDTPVPKTINQSNTVSNKPGVIARGKLENRGTTSNSFEDGGK